MKRAVFERTTRIAAPRADVFRFFSDPQNLPRITPPRLKFRVTNGPKRMLQLDDRIEYAFRIFGFPIRWRSHINLWRENETFADFQERGPYAFWLHTHTFRDVDGGTEMFDRVEYALPFGFLGRVVGGALVRRELKRIFDHRGTAVRDAFAV